MTEIEVYDTEQPADPATGERPLKARIRQRHGEERRTEEVATIATEEKSEATTEEDLTFDGGTLDEVAITATKAPGLWERAKQGAAWAAAVLILAAAGWIILRRAKR